MVLTAERLIVGEVSALELFAIRGVGAITSRPLITGCNHERRAYSAYFIIYFRTTGAVIYSDGRPSRQTGSVLRVIAPADCESQFSRRINLRPRWVSTAERFEIARWRFRTRYARMNACAVQSRDSLQEFHRLLSHAKLM